MTRPRRAPAAAAEDNHPWPQAGGSYQRDPATGELTRVEAPGDDQAEPPVTDDAGSDDADQAATEPNEQEG